MTDSFSKPDLCYIAKLSRIVAQHVQTAMRDTPVILLNGVRQTGKSTLAKEVAGTLGGDYVTLDDATLIRRVFYAFWGA